MNIDHLFGEGFTERLHGFFGAKGQKVKVILVTEMIDLDNFDPIYTFGDIFIRWNAAAMTAVATVRGATAFTISLQPEGPAIHVGETTGMLDVLEEDGIERINLSAIVAWKAMGHGKGVNW